MIKNFEELSVSAALRAERIACQMRNLVCPALSPNQAAYLPKVQMHRECGLQNSRGFSPLRFPDCFRNEESTQTLHFSMNRLIICFGSMIKQNALPLYRDCVICFSQIYDRELPQRRIRDYDNLEFKQILDTLCTYVLTDDSAFSVIPTTRHSLA